MTNEEKLKKLLSLMEPDGLTEEKFLAMTKQVFEFLKKMRDKNIAEFQMINKMLIEFSKKLKDDNIADITDLKGQVKNLIDIEIKKLIENYKNKINEIDKKMLEVKDGKDADEAIIAVEASKLAIEEILPQLPTIEAIEKDLPKLGDYIASALELLPEGEKLKIKAIEGLQEILDELKQRSQRLGGGGGFSYIAMLQHIVDDETPAGTINGINKIFTLTGTPNPVSSLKIYRAGARQRVTEDYTLARNIITFTTAPVNGEIILCDYKT